MLTWTISRSIRVLLLLSAVLCWPHRAGAQDAQTVDLVLGAGRSLRVALDRRVTIHQAGQPITGTLMEPVYVYDRIVLPVGSHLTGHIERLEQPSKKKRTLAVVEGDFSPHPHPILRFD